MTVMRPFTPGIYPEIFQARARRAVDDVAAPDHPRGDQMLEFRTPQIEITTLADIPAGTGLGSSGSFTTALLKALYTHRDAPASSPASWRSSPARSRSIGSASRSASRISTSPRTAASPASRSSQTTRVDREPLAISHGHHVRPRGQPAAVLHRLLAQRRQYPQGPERAHAAERRRHARRTCTTSRSLGYRSREALEAGNRRWFGELMHEHWDAQEASARTA